MSVDESDYRTLHRKYRAACEEAQAERDVSVELRQQLAAAEKRAERMEGALQPFADFAGVYDKQRPLTAFADEDVIYQFNDQTLTVGMLRAARAALKEGE